MVKERTIVDESGKLKTEVETNGVILKAGGKIITGVRTVKITYPWQQEN